jgi:hypothetical protein
LSPLSATPTRPGKRPRVQGGLLTMGWINDCLQQQKKSHAVKHTEQITVDRSEGVPAWECTWKKVRDVIKNDVLEFNNARGPQFMV